MLNIIFILLKSFILSSCGVKLVIIFCSRYICKEDMFYVFLVCCLFFAQLFILLHNLLVELPVTN